MRQKSRFWAGLSDMDSIVPRPHSLMRKRVWSALMIFEQASDYIILNVVLLSIVDTSDWGRGRTGACLWHNSLEGFGACPLRKSACIQCLCDIVPLAIKLCNLAQARKQIVHNTLFIRLASSADIFFVRLWYIMQNVIIATGWHQWILPPNPDGTGKGRLSNWHCCLYKIEFQTVAAILLATGSNSKLLIGYCIISVAMLQEFTKFI